MHILTEDGVDAATFLAIAERSRVHHALIYRCWKNRSALIQEAILGAADTIAPVPDTASCART